MTGNVDVDFVQLALDVKRWGRELGFQHIGISDVALDDAERRLLEWLGRGFHGEMRYMRRHGTRRSRPRELVPRTVRIISARLDYLPPEAEDAWVVLGNAALGFVSRYALGRDYHKIVRRRLQRLAERIAERVGPFGYRAFADSAPVMEKALAEKAGIGWIGKHTNLLDRRAGSWFFLGELYTDLPLPIDAPATEHCGRCTACIDVCPTNAIVAPFQLDARLCISYLTIELRGPIPEHLRRPMGNRIYGCDDCQLVCPWNRFAAPTTEPHFLPRNDLDAPQLAHLFAWTEQDFRRFTEGSPIRRIGFECWLRNIAVALGNAPPSASVRAALERRRDDPSTLVREHVHWAVEEQRRKHSGSV